MKEWWKNLTTREQLILSIGSTLAIIIIAYLFIWSPLVTSIASNKTYVQYQQSLLTWMKHANILLKNLRGSESTVQKVEASQLLATIDASLSQDEIKQYATSIQQSGTNKVLVNFKQIPFDLCIAWLQNLWQTNEIKVNQINIIPNPNVPGLVDVQLILNS